MHSTDNLEDGYLGSGKILGYSRRKYGDENHKKEILEYCNSRQELQEKEKQIVTSALMENELCVNLKIGGNGGGIFWSKDQHRNASISGNISKNRDHVSLQEKRLKTMRERDSFNRIMPDRTGIPLTQEHKNKCKATMRERGHMKGENNSQYGTCWVTNSVKPIKIQKEQLNEYLIKGYSRGRK